jgi:chromosome partitioning protein
MRIIALANQKGGAGKSTTLMNLAAVVAKSARVLVVDVDPQRSATDWADISGERLPFDFAPSTDPSQLSRMRELPYDVIFVDTPGNLTDSHILGAVLDVSDFVVVPINPEPLSVTPTRRTISTLIEPRGLPYRVLLSKIDMREKGQLEDWQAIVDGLGYPRFKQHIRKYKSHSDAPVNGDVVTQYPDTRQTTNAIFDYTMVALELTALWAHAPAGRH